jgi:hypothetical protein
MYLVRGPMVKEFIKDLIYRLWVLYGYWGWQIGGSTSARVTVLITYYNPARLKHISSQVRNLLKCKFVERIVISNHNPQLKIEDYVNISDPRLVFVNQEVRRGCGYRWLVANEVSANYLIVMDDDILLFPWQVQKLFLSLVAEPDYPHGLAGMVRQENGSMDYHQKQDRQVDYLCEIYAVTAKQLERYIHVQGCIVSYSDAAKSLDQTADFIVVSRTGSEKPKIHYVGHILRCPTFNQAGVAVHKEKAFQEDTQAVSFALEMLRTNEPCVNCIFWRQAN